MDNWVLKILACPRDTSALTENNGLLICESGHKYHLIDGIPIMLLDDVKQTHPISLKSLSEAKALRVNENVNNFSREDINYIDPYVQEMIAGTNGIMWKPIIGKLKHYPIPRIPLNDCTGKEKLLLDIGCGWGRWSISSAKKGYIPVGIDPSLDAIKAAIRVSKQLGYRAYFLVADARYLPFGNNLFDTAFSFSVIQHFDKKDATICVKQIARVLKKLSVSYIQMPNVYGFRNFIHQLKRLFKEPRDFEVRYWTLSELKNLFQMTIGYTELFADSYLNLNPDIGNIDFLPYNYRFVIYFSEFLKKINKIMPGLINCADSIYVRSINEKVDSLQQEVTQVKLG